MPWNPAVPPPPVTGAPDGTVLVGVVVIVCVTVTTGWAGDVSEARPGVPVGDVVPDVGDVPDEADAGPVPDEVLTDGEKTVGVVVDEDEVHAETATGTSSVRAPQHNAVSLAQNGVPVVAPRTFMDPPPAPGR